MRITITTDAGAKAQELILYLRARFGPFKSRGTVSQYRVWEWEGEESTIREIETIMQGFEHFPYEIG